MANVEEYGNRKQTLRPVFTRKMESRATPDAFGAGIGRAMQNFASGLSQAGNAVEAVRGLEDNAIVEERVNQYSDFARERTYNPETGFANQNGRVAVEGRQQFETDLEKERTSLGKGLSPKQQHLFDKATEARRSQALDTGIKHASNQRKKWFEEASAARLNTYAEDSLAMSEEPEKLKLNLAAASKEIAKQAVLSGWSPEQAAEAQSEYLSGVHKNIVLKNAVSDPFKAKEWLDQNRGGMTQAHQIELDRMLDEPVREMQAQLEAESIIYSGNRPVQRASVSSGAYGHDDHDGHNHGAHETSSPVDMTFKKANAGTDTEHLNAETKTAFGRLQGALGKRLTVKSGYRDAARNKKAGGAKKSRHMHGDAIDLDIRGMSKAERLDLIDAAFDAGFTGVGVGPTSLHIDQGSPRAWGYATSSGGAPVPAYAAELVNRRLKEKRVGGQGGQRAHQEHKRDAVVQRKVKAPAWDGKDVRGGILEAAQSLGIGPVVLATAMSYETGGTFDPTKKGPTTQWGQHRGLLQFGEPQAKKYGVDWNDPVGSQLGANGAVVKYLKAAGVKPGMGLLEVYSAINAGSVGKHNASDANNGGAPGTVKDKVQFQMNGHRKKAQELIGEIDGRSVSVGRSIEGYVGPQYIADQVAHIADPRLRAKTAARLATMYNAQDVAEQRARKQNNLIAEKWIIENPGVKPSQLPIEVQQQLGVDGMNTMWSYNDRLEQEGSIETNEQLYAHLTKLQAEDPEAFARDVDLFDYIDKLSTKDRRDLQQLQVDAIKDRKSGKTEALTKSKSVSTAMSIATERLEAAGIRKSGKNATNESRQHEAQFQRALIDRMKEFQEQNKRVPTDFEVSDMVDQLLTPIVMSAPGKLWGTNEEEGFMFEAPFRKDNQTVAVDMPYEQIPVDVRTAIRAELEAEKGREPTEDEVKQEYVEVVLGFRGSNE